MIISLKITSKTTVYLSFMHEFRRSFTLMKKEIFNNVSSAFNISGLMSTEEIKLFQLVINWFKATLIASRRTASLVIAESITPIAS